jgi:hypothetical protein
MLKVILRSLKTGLTAIAYWTVLKLAPSISLILLVVEGDVGSNIEKLEDWLETLDKLLLLLAFNASALLKLAPSISFIVLAVKGDVGSNTKKLEDWLETLEKLLLLLASAAGICCPCLLEAETERRQFHQKGPR